jgi:hypothetical protein
VADYGDAINPEQHSRSKVAGRGTGDYRSGWPRVAISKSHLLGRPPDRTFNALQQDIAGESVGDDYLRAPPGRHVMALNRTGIPNSKCRKSILHQDMCRHAQ